MNYLNYLKPVKTFLIKQKGWIPVVMGFLISMLCAVFLIPLNKLLGKMIEPVVELFKLSYKVEDYILALPGNFLTNTITGLMLSFVISSLIYILKSNKDIAIVEYFKVFITFISKYVKQMFKFLVIPTFVVEILSDIIISLAVKNMIGGYMSSVIMSYEHPIKYWFLKQGTVALLSTIAILINLLCIVKFITLIEEIQFDDYRKQEMYVITIMIAVACGVISLIPVIGPILGTIMMVLIAPCFAPFILTFTRDFNTKMLV